MAHPERTIDACTLHMPHANFAGLLLVMRSRRDTS